MSDNLYGRTGEVAAAAAGGDHDGALLAVDTALGDLIAVKREPPPAVPEPTVPTDFVYGWLKEAGLEECARSCHALLHSDNSIHISLFKICVKEEPEI